MLELQPLSAKAEPEDIPLDIVYEDEHLLVVNKPAHMVVHPAPRNANGTLVNAIFHHCKISTFTCLARNSIDDECPESSDDDVDVFDVDQFAIGEVSSDVREGIVRPGIVHRLDKGTSGLLVIAKDEHSHAQLAEQFKLHTISRVFFPDKKFISLLFQEISQIRAHAKYLGNPLLGDETYEGTKSMALSLLRPRTPSKYHGDLSNLISKIDRPCLHAALLG
uniref:RNA pseudourine synthase 2, chloroplastic n=1 Tax=Aegilops tauschii TaxID=37682 RepID=M8BU77_AEGTA